MRTSFHHQPEAQHPNFQLSTSWQADYPIFRAVLRSSPELPWRTRNSALFGIEIKLGPTIIAT
jgi:hypothetical protein